MLQIVEEWTVAGWSCALWEPPVRDADPKIRQAARDLENDMFKKHYASSSFSMQNLCWNLVVEMIEVQICKTPGNCCKITEEWPLKTTVRCVRTSGSLSGIPKSVKLRATSRTTIYFFFFFLFFFDAAKSLIACRWNDRNLCKNLRTCSQLTVERRRCAPLHNLRFFKQVRRGAARDRCLYSLALFSRRANLFPDNGWRKVPSGWNLVPWSNL